MAEIPESHKCGDQQNLRHDRSTEENRGAFRCWLYRDADRIQVHRREDA